MNEQNWGLLVHRINELEEREKALAADLARYKETHSAEVEELKAKIAEREQERQTEERRRLLAGISFLGSIILALVGVIWAYRGTIFQIGGK
jgi:Ca2+/Na+ antiporter